MPDNHKTLTYRYQFKFKDGKEKNFEVNLDYETLKIIQEEKIEYPPWTKLDFCKCPNCPLEAAKNEHCPVAKNISGLIDFFKDMVSFDKVDVVVESPGRTYAKETSVQKGLSRSEEHRLNSSHSAKSRMPSSA